MRPSPDHYRSPRYDIDDSGEIDTLETSKALRAFGYPTSIEVVQDTIREVDVDGSGEMDLAEFLKIIRIFRNREMWKLLKQFERKNMDSAEGGKESKQSKVFFAVQEDVPTTEDDDSRPGSRGLTHSLSQRSRGAGRDLGCNGRNYPECSSSSDIVPRG